MAHGKAKLSLLDKVENGRLKVQQGIIAGCSGGNYENVIAAANALRGQSCGNDTFSLAVYPSSQPVFNPYPQKGVSRFDLRRRIDQNRVLRPMLWRGRYANQQRIKYSPHHA
ncbi:hypothetical protein ACLBR5_23260 [Escherichia coli]